MGRHSNSRSWRLPASLHVLDTRLPNYHCHSKCATRKLCEDRRDNSSNHAAYTERLHFGKYLDLLRGLFRALQRSCVCFFWAEITASVLLVNSLCLCLASARSQLLSSHLRSEVR